MAAKYQKPVLIHLSDSIGRFYPISPKNERYEAGLWHQPGDTSGNLYKDGPPNDVIERARENPTIVVLDRLARALKVDIRELLAPIRPGDPTPKPLPSGRRSNR